MLTIAGLIDYNAYKLLHIIGIILTFMGFAYGMKQWSKGAAIAHGTGLAILLVTGMGMVGSNFAPWVFAKIFIWLLLGGALVIVKRKLLPAVVSWILLLVLGAAAAWIVFYGKELFVSV